MPKHARAAARAARAKLRARRLQFLAALSKLENATEALDVATTGLSAAMREETITDHDVYVLLRALYSNLQHAIDDIYVANETLRGPYAG